MPTDTDTSTSELKIAYAVWRRGKGWLRTSKGEPFSDLSHEVAVGAASFFGSAARVVPFDDAMLDLEPQFIRGEQNFTERLLERLRGGK